MTIASPSPLSFSSSFCSSHTDSNTLSFTRFPSISFHRFSQSSSNSLSQRISISSRLNSSIISVPGGFSIPDNEEVPYELEHNEFPLQRRKRGSLVFVTLPIDAVTLEGQVRRGKTMLVSFMALAAAGVEGVVMEVWWGLVEQDEPRSYKWKAYLDLVALAHRCGLKVRAVFLFNQNGKGPDDPCWIPFPKWVREEIIKDPNLAYSDRFGSRNTDYITLGCDTLPVLRGRSPIQAYADVMRSFRDTFRHYLGVIVTGIQVGMGPAGELRYPSCSSQTQTKSWQSSELGEFQCYDKYMLASLKAHAREIGMPKWGNRGPIRASNLINNPEHTQIFSDEDSRKTAHGDFFLKWYSKMLLEHGERICREAEAIFRGFEVDKSAKLVGFQRHYRTKSRPSELRAAGYYNTSTRVGFLPIARMFSRYGFTMCCSGFDLKDVVEKQMNPVSIPLLWQLLMAASACDMPLEGENSETVLDDSSFQQVLKISRFYSVELEKPSFSFNFVRMHRKFFESTNWNRFARFVKQMSDDSNHFQAKLDPGSNRGLRLSSTTNGTKYYYKNDSCVSLKITSQIHTACKCSSPPNVMWM